MALSTEALEDLATRVRSWALTRLRARLEDTAPPLVARIDASPLVDAYPRVRAADPVLGTWLAEAVTLASLDGPCDAYARAWRSEPIVLRGESPIALRSLRDAMALEPNEHRRASVLAAADEKAREHLADARAVVTALRTCATERLHLANGPALYEALGLGSSAAIARAAHAALDATDDVFREADGWLRARLGLARTGELAWSDVLRVRASLRASENVAVADRFGIASRWLSRCGLDAAVSGVRDATLPATPYGERVYALIDEPGARASVIGTPARTIHGVVALTASVAQAALSRTARAPRICERAGTDRVHDALAHVLGRRLFLDPGFLEREAGVDRGVSASLSIEFVYDELWTVRVDAAHALFAIDVLAQSSDLPARYREFMVRALGTAPAPAWAAHIAASWDLAPPVARTIANVVEPCLRESLRNAYDEDWFRNPRSGEGLLDRFAMMRREGTLTAWARMRTIDDPLAVISPDPLARRVREAFG